MIVKTLFDKQGVQIDIHFYILQTKYEKHKHF